MAPLSPPSPTAPYAISQLSPLTTVVGTTMILPHPQAFNTIRMLMTLKIMSSVLTSSLNSRPTDPSTFTLVKTMCICLPHSTWDSACTLLYAHHHRQVPDVGMVGAIKVSSPKDLPSGASRVRLSRVTDYSALKPTEMSPGSREVETESINQLALEQGGIFWATFTYLGLKK